MSLLFNLFLAVLSLLMCSPAVKASPTSTSYSSSPPKAVFAHVIVGNNQGWSSSDWSSDIALAQAAGIDGFVLNIAMPLTSIQTSITNAFAAAESSGFKLLFSFDYLGGSGPWDKTVVATLITTSAVSSAYYKVNGQPFVSTFEGTANIGDWAAIRAAVPGGIYFLPDWTSLGPAGFASQCSSTVDGAFSWDMWPTGANDMTATDDLAWQQALGGSKAFMMGVSPWFFTDLTAYNKHWVWRGDDMWHTRWQQVLQVNPQFVEIVTWNDYGESHYIGPVHDDGIPTGGSGYVDGMPHDAWRETLPYYIAAYKNGGSAPVTQEKLTYWYRLAPVSAGDVSNPVISGNAPYQATVDPRTVPQDKVFVTAIVNSAATITVTIGGVQAGQPYQCTTSGACHFSVPFGSSIGAVVITMTRNGQTVLSGTGANILAQPASGRANFNAWAGSATGSSSTGGSGGNSTGGGYGSTPSSGGYASSPSPPSAYTPTAAPPTPSLPATTPKPTTLSTTTKPAAATVNIVTSIKYVYVTPVPVPHHRRHRRSHQS